MPANDSLFSFLSTGKKITFNTIKKEAATNGLLPTTKITITLL